MQFTERLAVGIPADGVRGTQFVRVVGVGENGQSVLSETVQGVETAHVSGGSATILHGHRKADHRLPERQPSAPKRFHTAIARNQKSKSPRCREQQR